MKVLEEWFFEAPWGKIALISWGNPRGEPVLLVHGRRDSASTFIPLLEMLPDDYYYVGLDMPGHGKSDPLPSVVAWGDCYDPPVLVCHGSRDSVVSFRPLMELLPKNFYYIGLELPGCGRSDPMPPGIMISVFDLVYSIQVVVKHFRWKSFTYLAHSLGCILGKMYNLSYPGKINKCIDLDPYTLNLAFKVEEFPAWYDWSFTSYFKDYKKINMTQDEKPTFTEEQALSKMMARRGLDRGIARQILERLTEPVGNGLVRFTFDDRISHTTHPPYPPEHIHKLLKSIKTPTLTIITEDSKDSGKYLRIPFLLDEASFAGNYRIRVVPGNHDVHVIYPERVATFVGQFLLHGLAGLDGKAKL